MMGPDPVVEGLDFGDRFPGCDVERCPKCGGQSISCGCGILETDG